MYVNNKTFEAIKKKKYFTMGLSKLLKSYQSVGHPEYHKATEKCYHLVVLYVLHAHSVFFCSHIQPPELKIEVNMAKVEVPPGAT